jgi:hypothetical protein
VLVARLADAKDHTLQQVEVSVQNTSNNETRIVRTYAPGPVNSDPYYRENMVLGDLPAALYKVSFAYDGKPQQEWVYIYAGQVTYFTFQGAKGFEIGLPPAPALKSLPTETPTATP